MFYAEQVCTELQSISPFCKCTKNRKRIKIADIHLRFAIVIRKHQMVHVEKDSPLPQTSVNQHYYISTPYHNCGQVKVH